MPAEVDVRASDNFRSGRAARDAARDAAPDGARSTDLAGHRGRRRHRAQLGHAPVPHSLARIRARRAACDERMRYLRSTSLTLDKQKLVAFLGCEPHTALDEALCTTLAGLGCDQSQVPSQGRGHWLGATAVTSKNSH
jgi:hypothetical protein